MAVSCKCQILENKKAEGGFWLIRLAFPAYCAPGQFVMLRVTEGLDPLLGRPISVYDYEDGVLSLLYQPVGRGTKQLTALASGQEAEVQGPLGNGFPIKDGDAVLIGGGVGIAPLYYLSKALKKADPARKVTMHLGFREQAAMADTFRAVCDELVLNIGGYVTDDVDFVSAGKTYYACGPTPMMCAAADKADPVGAALYVSLEERMACGVGACLGCTVKTTQGNRRVCKDGPVFLSTEVLFHG